MLMHASCGTPLHGLGVFGPGAFTIFRGGAGFSTFTTVGGGAGVSTMVDVGGGVIDATGVCAGGSDAQALRTNASAIVSEYRETMVPIPPVNMRGNGRKRNGTPRLYHRAVGRRVGASGSHVSLRGAPRCLASPLSTTPSWLWLIAPRRSPASGSTEQRHCSCIRCARRGLVSLT